MLDKVKGFCADCVDDLEVVRGVPPPLPWNLTSGAPFSIIKTFHCHEEGCRQAIHRISPRLLDLKRLG